MKIVTLQMKNLQRCLLNEVTKANVTNTGTNWYYVSSNIILWERHQITSVKSLWKMHGLEKQNKFTNNLHTHFPPILKKNVAHRPMSVRSPPGHLICPQCRGHQALVGCQSSSLQYMLSPGAWESLAPTRQWAYPCISAEYGWVLAGAQFLRPEKNVI